MSVLIHFLKWRLGLAPPEVWTTPLERDCLVRHVKGRRRVAEIGVWHGGTARSLRAAMDAEGVFFAIDPYEPGRLGVSFPRLVGVGELESVANGRLVWVREAGVAAASSAAIREAAPLDFVFVDAAQTYDTLRAQWEAWSPLIAPGGVIALHDTRPMLNEPEQTSVRYAREVVARDSRFETIDGVDSLTVLRRR